MTEGSNVKTLLRNHGVKGDPVLRAEIMELIKEAFDRGVLAGADDPKLVEEVRAKIDTGTADKPKTIPASEMRDRLLAKLKSPVIVEQILKMPVEAYWSKAIAEWYFISPCGPFVWSDPTYGGNNTVRDAPTSLQEWTCSINRKHSSPYYMGKGVASTWLNADIKIIEDNKNETQS